MHSAQMLMNVIWDYMTVILKLNAQIPMDHIAACAREDLLVMAKGLAPGRKHFHWLFNFMYVVKQDIKPMNLMVIHVQLSGFNFTN